MYEIKNKYKVEKNKMLKVCNLKRPTKLQNKETFCNIDQEKREDTKKQTRNKRAIKLWIDQKILMRILFQNTLHQKI